MDKNVYLEKQNDLQKQAQEVLNSLGLINILSVYGEVKIVGSVALGLMTWPDIDIDLKSEAEINNKCYFEIIQKIFSQKDIKQLILIDNRSSFEKNRPQSMYIGIIYNLNGIDWKIDIRYLNPTAAWAEEDIKQIKEKLTKDKIISILEIKSAFCNHPQYRRQFSGHDVYRAVLDKNISTPEEFSIDLAERGIKL